MGDLEHRLTQALRHGGGAEPSGFGLADGRRRRPRRGCDVRHGHGGLGPARLLRGAEFALGGCAPSYPATRPGGVDVARAIFVTVCRYSADGRLVRSGELDLVDSTSARVAVQDAAPTIDGLCRRPADGPVVTLSSGDVEATVDLRRSCFTLADDPTSRSLTPQLRRYASTGTSVAGR